MDRGDLIDRYLNSKVFKLWFFAYDRNEIPFLFWDGHVLLGKYEKVINLSGIFHDDKKQTFHISRSGFLEDMARYLREKGQDIIYAAGNWSGFSGLEHRIYQIDPDDLQPIMDKNAGFDIYFFPSDLSWLLAFNHHSLGFFAGKRDFVEKFTKEYKDIHGLVLGEAEN